MIQKRQSCLLLVLALLIAPPVWSSASGEWQRRYRAEMDLMDSRAKDFRQRQVELERINAARESGKRAMAELRKKEEDRQEKARLEHLRWRESQPKTDEALLEERFQREQEKNLQALDRARQEHLRLREAIIQAHESGNGLDESVEYGLR